MKDEILKRKLENLTTYTDDVSPISWCELVHELVSEIQILEAEIDSIEKREVHE